MSWPKYARLARGLVLSLRQEPYLQGAPYAVCQMDTHGSHRVVYVESNIKELHHEDHEEAGYHADHGGSQSVQGVASCRDAHKPRQGGVYAH